MIGFHRKLRKLMLASLLAAPFALLAAEAAPADAHSHHAAAAQPTTAAAPSAKTSADKLQERMQARLRAMRQVSDPQQRMDMMVEQMQDMQDWLAGMHAHCHMAMDGKGMMGGKKMIGGMKHDAPDSHGEAGAADAAHDHAK